MDNSVLTARIPPDVLAEFQRLCALQGIPASRRVRQLIRIDIRVHELHESGAGTVVRTELQAAFAPAAERKAANAVVDAQLAKMHRD